MSIKVIKLKTVESGNGFVTHRADELFVSSGNMGSGSIGIVGNDSDYIEEIYSKGEVYSKKEVDDIKIELASEITKSLTQIQKDLQIIKNQIIEDKPFRDKVVESLLEKERFIEDVSKKVASIVQSELG